MRPMLEHSVTHNLTISQDLSLFHIDFFIFYLFYIELRYFYSSAISTLTLFRMAFSGMLTDGGGGQKAPLPL